MPSKMDPRGILPNAEYSKLQSKKMSLLNRVRDLEVQSSSRSEVSVAAPLNRKPLRRETERLPVATEIDKNLILNKNDRNMSFQDLPVAMMPSRLEKEKSEMVVDFSFDGGLDIGESIPPDTAGAVSENHVFNPLNDNINIFDREGNILLTVSLDDFWGFYYPGVNTFDPKVIYDPHERRFIFVSVADGQQLTSSLLIAVSHTEDPLGEWSAVRKQVDPSKHGSIWFDYPSLGFTNDKITVQVNMYSITENLFSGSLIYVFDKQEFYNSPHDPESTEFPLDKGGVQVPAITYDEGVTRQYLVGRWSGNIDGLGYLVLFEITGSVAKKTAEIKQLGFIQARGQTWESFSPSGDFGSQLGTSRKIDCGDDRLLTVVFRNGTLWCSHAVYLPISNPTRTAAQWWQFDPMGKSVRQLGRIEDVEAGKFYAFPTISVNRNNDVVLGMTEFSLDQYPSAVYAYRFATDRTNQMSSPIIYQDGQSSYFKVFTGSSNRWGDYSATQVDPVNDLDFWTIQEYSSETKNMWATRWAHITLKNS